MKQEYYLIIGLLLVIIVILSNRKMKDDEKKEEEPIRYWTPGHLMSYYYPFHVPLRFRRHHRFHRREFK